MLQLVSKSGALQGRAWVIGETPLVFGRDQSCAIRINDPVVSRRHCRIYLHEGTAYIRDMDSRNATLVNGVPVRETTLKAGDEVAVGASVFLVAQLHDSGKTDKAMGGKLDDTSSLKINVPIYSSASGDSLFRKGTPHTTQELVQLFTFGRALSQTSSIMQLLATLQHYAEERFQPAAFWLVLRRVGDAAPYVLPAENTDALRNDATLYRHVLKAIDDKRSLLFPQVEGDADSGTVKTTIISPVALGQESLGALVVQARSEERVYEESDLEYLIAHAYALAPYIRVVERLERLEQENQRLVAGHEGPMVGDSPALTALRAQARDAARSRISVLILGETGTGKELAARMIHGLSDLSDKPLVVVNCAAIPDELFESEVFGHERGAFTGAHNAKKGLLEESNGGTLFLDEVGDLSLANQARLLRAIETGSYRRLGGSSTLHADVRVVAATNKNLEKEVNAGRFRRDLYHRLNGFELRVPPLRERRGDIPALAEHFRRQAFKRDKRGPTGFTAEALQTLERHSWPGNARELRNIIERAMVVAKTETISVNDLGLSNGETPSENFATLAEMEQRHIEEALRRCNGKVPEAAAILGIGRSTLYRKIAEYGLQGD